MALSAWFRVEAATWNFDRQTGNESLDFEGLHLSWTAFVMKKNVTPNPLDLGLFGTVGIMAGAKGVAHLV
jgi:hypothetical protein